MNIKDRLEKLYLKPEKKDILYFLKLEDIDELKSLYQFADKVRQEEVGNDVHLRGIIEFSNHCFRECLYCGINSQIKDVYRYRMDIDEIIELAIKAWHKGYKTIVLQSGEDLSYKKHDYVKIIKGIKEKVPIAITLGIGEKNEEEYRAYKDAGADRYLLKHESSDPVLYSQLNPKMSLEVRINCLRILKKLGYETGSGIMIGLPDQTLKSIAQDIMLFKELDIDMIGCGPFIPHEKTKLKNALPGNIELSFKVLALNRIVGRNTNLPSTTALSAIGGKDTRELALLRGANVIMPNLTPYKYRVNYEIYPNKKKTEAAENDFFTELHLLTKKIGRKISETSGNRVKRNVQ